MFKHILSSMIFMAFVKAVRINDVDREIVALKDFSIKIGTDENGNDILMDIHKGDRGGILRNTQIDKDAKVWVSKDSVVTGSFLKDNVYIEDSQIHAGKSGIEISDTVIRKSDIENFSDKKIALSKSEISESTLVETNVDEAIISNSRSENSTIKNSTFDRAEIYNSSADSSVITGSSVIESEINKSEINSSKIEYSKVDDVIKADACRISDANVTNTAEIKNCNIERTNVVFKEKENIENASLYRGDDITDKREIMPVVSTDNLKNATAQFVNSRVAVTGIGKDGSLKRFHPDAYRRELENDKDNLEKYDKQIESLKTGNEERVDVSGESSVEEQKGKSIDNPGESPVEETKGKSIDNTGESPIEETKGKSIDNTEESPVEEAKEKSIENPEKNEITYFSENLDRIEEYCNDEDYGNMAESLELLDKETSDVFETRTEAAVMALDKFGENLSDDEKQAAVGIITLKNTINGEKPDTERKGPFSKDIKDIIAYSAIAKTKGERDTLKEKLHELREDINNLSKDKIYSPDIWKGIVDKINAISNNEFSADTKDAISKYGITKLQLNDNGSITDKLGISLTGKIVAPCENENDTPIADLIKDYCEALNNAIDEYNSEIDKHNENADDDHKIPDDRKIEKFSTDDITNLGIALQAYNNNDKVEFGKDTESSLEKYRDISSKLSGNHCPDNNEIDKFIDDRFKDVAQEYERRKEDPWGDEPEDNTPMVREDPNAGGRSVIWGLTGNEEVDKYIDKRNSFIKNDNLFPHYTNNPVYHYNTMKAVQSARKYGVPINGKIPTLLDSYNTVMGLINGWNLWDYLLESLIDKIGQAIDKNKENFNDDPDKFKYERDRRFVPEKQYRAEQARIAFNRDCYDYFRTSAIASNKLPLDRDSKDIAVLKGIDRRLDGAMVKICNVFGSEAGHEMSIIFREVVDRVKKQGLSQEGIDKAIKNIESVKNVKRTDGVTIKVDITYKPNKTRESADKREEEYLDKKDNTENKEENKTEKEEKKTTDGILDEILNEVEKSEEEPEKQEEEHVEEPADEQEKESIGQEEEHVEEPADEQEKESIDQEEEHVEEPADEQEKESIEQEEEHVEEPKEPEGDSTDKIMAEMLNEVEKSEEDPEEPEEYSTDNIMAEILDEDKSEEDLTNKPEESPEIDSEEHKENIQEQIPDQINNEGLEKKNKTGPEDADIFNIHSDADAEEDPEANDKEEKKITTNDSSDKDEQKVNSIETSTFDNDSSVSDTVNDNVSPAKDQINADSPASTEVISPDGDPKDSEPAVDDVPKKVEAQGSENNLDNTNSNPPQNENANENNSSNSEYMGEHQFLGNENNEDNTEKTPVKIDTADSESSNSELKTELVPIIEDYISNPMIQDIDFFNAEITVNGEKMTIEDAINNDYIDSRTIAEAIYDAKIELPADDCDIEAMGSLLSSLMQEFPDFLQDYTDVYDENLTRMTESGNENAGVTDEMMQLFEAIDEVQGLYPDPKAAVTDEEIDNEKLLQTDALVFGINDTLQEDTLYDIESIPVEEKIPIDERPASMDLVDNSAVSADAASAAMDAGTDAGVIAPDMMTDMMKPESLIDMNAGNQTAAAAAEAMASAEMQPVMENPFETQPSDVSQPETVTQPDVQFQDNPDYNDNDWED